VLDEYEEQARLCGAVFSSSAKHFRSRSGGVFAEVVFYCGEDPTQWAQPSPREGEVMGAGYDLLSSHLFPEPKVGLIGFPEVTVLRGLLPDCGSQDRETSPENRFCPPVWAAVGVSVESQGSTRRTVRAALAAWPGLLDWLRSRGLSPSLPRSMGGMGLWWPEMPAAQACGSRRVARKVAKLLVEGGPLRRDPSLFSRLWVTEVSQRRTESSELVADLIARGVERGVVRFEGDPLPSGVLGPSVPRFLNQTPTELEDSCIAVVDGLQDFVSGVTPTRKFRFPSPGALGRSIARRMSLPGWDGATPVSRPIGSLLAIIGRDEPQGVTLGLVNEEDPESGEWIYGAAVPLRPHPGISWADQKALLRRHSGQGRWGRLPP
jgi:hypothetical protein